MLNRIKNILSKCDSEDTRVSPTELYNEGWLLRLVLDWFEENKNNSLHHELTLDTDARWYSEILLPSQFLPRHKGDKLAESYTNADGVIGHFQIGNQGKGDIKLDDNISQFKVVEAKIYSKLSSGVSNASYYNQAARNIACIAESLSRDDIDIKNLNDIGFYVLAPGSQIEKKSSFKRYTSKQHIENTVLRRVREYEKKDKLKWYNNWFKPTLENMDTKCISWEEIINFINISDDNTGNELEKFYDKCLKYN